MSATLHPAIASTFSLFKARSRYTARQVADLHDNGTTPAVIHARLEKLRRLHLLEREYCGAAWEYFRPAKSK